jgi:hypothetical protein
MPAAFCAVSAAFCAALAALAAAAELAFWARFAALTVLLVLSSAVFFLVKDME